MGHQVHRLRLLRSLREGGFIMSNKRKLKPPPSGFDYRKFIRVIQESDLDEETKRQVLVRAAYADRKGRIPKDSRGPG